MRRVVTLVLPDVVALQAAIPAQVFGHRNEAERYSLAVCAERPGEVPSTTGLAVHASMGLDALDGADTIIVPGYWPPGRPLSPAVIAALRGARDRGARIASICTGAFALAGAGLLDGVAATTHWQESDEFARQFPQVRLRRDVLFVDEGRLLTSAGDLAGIDLCLHLYREDYGVAAVTEVAKRMTASAYRTGDQAQVVSRPLPTTSTGLAETRAWMLGRLQESMTVGDLARRAGYAPRTFARQFLAETGLTPIRWLSAQRVLEAQRLLEASDLPIDEVARRAGLGTAANLRLHLARKSNTTPSAYRLGFRPWPAGPSERTRHYP